MIQVVTVLPFVVASWLSLSGKGLSILIRVTGLTKEYYELYWDTLNEKVFNNRLCTGARSYHKFCCLSSDPTIYYNPDAKPFESTYDLEEDKKSIISTYKEKDSIISTNDTFLKTVFYKTQLPDNEFENIYTPVVKPHGVKSLQVNLYQYKYRKIPIGSRNKELGAICMQLIGINPNTEKKRLYNALCSINEHYTEQPLSVKEVKDIFESNYKKLQEGTLDCSKYYKVKYVFWHRNCKGIPADEKRIISLDLSAQTRKQVTEQLINDAIEELQDGTTKINQQSVADYTKLSIITVKRYWSTFKSIVKDYNDSLKKKPLSKKNSKKRIISTYKEKDSIISTNDTFFEYPAPAADQELTIEA